MIKLIVTHGYGNGTFDGTIPTVTTRGYIAGAPAPISSTVAVFRNFIALAIGLRL